MTILTSNSTKKGGVQSTSSGNNASGNVVVSTASSTGVGSSTSMTSSDQSEPPIIPVLIQDANGVATGTPQPLATQSSSSSSSSSSSTSVEPNLIVTGGGNVIPSSQGSPPPPSTSSSSSSLSHSPISPSAGIVIGGGVNTVVLEPADVSNAGATPMLSDPSVPGGESGASVGIIAGLGKKTAKSKLKKRKAKNVAAAYQRRVDVEHPQQLYQMHHSTHSPTAGTATTTTQPTTSTTPTTTQKSSWPNLASAQTGSSCSSSSSSSSSASSPPSSPPQSQSSVPTTSGAVAKASKKLSSKSSKLSSGLMPRVKSTSSSSSSSSSSAAGMTSKSTGAAAAAAIATTSSNSHYNDNTLTTTTKTTTTTTNYYDNENNNSEDEYEMMSPAVANTSAAAYAATQKAYINLQEIEENFCRALKEKKGFIIKPTKEDGACLFRAVADQIYGDEEMHSTVRCQCMDYIAKNADYFKQYITEDVNRYINRKRQDTCFGNHIEIIAMAEIYNRPIEVYEYGTEPKNTFQSVFQTDNEPIRLSYHGRNHYNSVVDPYKATIGVGLGLPQYMPGLAEKNLMADALKKSEDFQIEQTMLDDKLKATDWEATNEEIMELVAQESYLQWLKDNEKRSIGGSSGDIVGGVSGSTSHQRQRQQDSNESSSSAAAAAMCSSWSHPSPTRTTTTATPIHHQHNHHHHHHHHHSSKQSPLLGATAATSMGGATAVADLDDDSDILAQVLAASQQEYLDSLKAKRHQNRSS